MAERGWQVPADARRSAGDDAIGAHLRAGRLTYETTLRAIVAAGDQPAPINDWATRVCVGLDAQRQSTADALLAQAGVPDSPPAAKYYGLLDPAWPEGERMLAVIRRDYPTGPLQRWDGAEWEDVPSESEPIGMPYADLTGNVSLLVAALEASAYNQQLILRPGSPRAFLPREHLPTILAAVEPADGGAHVYAIVDDLDSTAVLNLIRVSPGPVVELRQGGEWTPSPDTLTQLTSVDPPAVVEVAPEQVDDVTRQVDDFDTKNPGKAPKPTTDIPLPEDDDPVTAGFNPLEIRDKIGRWFRGLEEDGTGHASESEWKKDPKARGMTQLASDMSARTLTNPSRARHLTAAKAHALAGEYHSRIGSPVAATHREHALDHLRHVKSIDRRASGAVYASADGNYNALLTEMFPPLVAAGPDFSNGVMVSLFPELAAARELAVPGGQDVDQLHCTLAYLGEAGDDVDVSPYRLMEIVGTWAASQPPLVGQVAGVGQFVGGEDGPVTYASVDVPGLAEARTDLIRSLQEAGVSLPNEHGFTPHITLLYGDEPVAVGNTPLRFNDVVVSYGDSDLHIPLGQKVSELIASAQWSDGSALTAATIPEPPKAAGILLHAQDTGRVLMLQRALDDEDPASGMWEAPGGTLEPGETPQEAGYREWSEETGVPAPLSPPVSMWRSSNGVYHGYVVPVSSEDDVPINVEEGRVMNPDDPDGDNAETVAWWDPDHLEDNPAVRPELAQDVPLVLKAIKQSANGTLPVTAAGPERPAHSMMPEHLKQYWAHGEGALKIHWGIHGDFNRCRRHLAKYLLPTQVSGACAQLHKIATGFWPGPKSPV